MPEPLTLMTVHAHLDDAAIGTGGVLARYADEGIRTVLVTCTGGEAPGALRRAVRHRSGPARRVERPDEHARS